MSLRVAVVGAGYLGQHHARIYSELSGVELAGVVDISEERAEEVARRYASRAYHDYRDVLSTVDAVSIAVPTTHHFEIALSCIQAGKDVLVEKPITTTVSQADELIREATRLNRILQVGHLERYNSGVVTLSRMVHDPHFIEAVRVSPFLNRGCDVDITLDLMIHDIDIVLSLVPSPIKSINAFGSSFVTDMIDEARVWIEFENGTKASLTASRISREKQRRLKVFQKDSCLELDYLRSEVWSLTKEGATEIITPEYQEPLKEELKDFVHCSVGRERPKVCGTKGRNALTVALEIASVIKARA
jgi:predicted dehydrogenase